jgi:glycosyltransferase involved in cell wall biosynthesis
MHVTLDVSAAVNGKAGLGRYARTLAAALAEERSGCVSLFANFTGGGRIPAELDGLPVRRVRAGYKLWRMAVWLAQLAQIGFDRWVGETDLFHATEHLLVPMRAAPSVLTVHDLIFNLFPAHHKKLNYWFLNAAMPLFVRRADHIIAVSEATKRDLIGQYGTPEDKITVVYEAAAPHFQPQSPERIEAARRKFSLPERYLITVGTVEPRKNLARLVEALSILRREDPGLRLVVAGSRGWLTGSFDAALEKFGQRDAVIEPGWITDADLPALYAGALVSVTPSLYEGFGLPVLEAMACGAPVACSATSSVGEIAGDAALLFNPESVAGMYEVIRTLLRSPDLRAHLREKGRRRAAEFSWQRSARATWEVYERQRGISR